MKKLILMIFFITYNPKPLRKYHNFLPPVLLALATLIYFQHIFQTFR